MFGKKSCRFVALLTVFAVFFGRATSKFVGFGALSGDADSLSEDGNSTQLLMESRTGFRIGDTFYRAVYIGSYGVVSFGSPLEPCCTAWHPEISVNRVPFIAPLWTRGDPVPWSHVYYRQSLTDSELQEVEGEIRRGYSLQRFTPELVLVVTWVDLPCCSIEDTGPDVNNTFQLVLVSDYLSTYVLLNYENDVVLTETSVVRLAGISWWAGINFGDGRYFKLPWQLTDSSELPSETNVTSLLFKLTENPVETTNRGREFYFAFSKTENRIPNIEISIATDSVETVTVEVTGFASSFSRTVKVSDGLGDRVSLNDLYTEQLMLVSSFKSNGGLRVRVTEGRKDATVSVSALGDVEYQSGGFLVPSVDGANFMQFEDGLLKYYAVMYSSQSEENFSYMIVVSQHDGTVIEVTPSQPAKIGSRQTTIPGRSKTVSLNRNETLIIQSELDLTGSTVTTWGGKPIAFYCGHTSTEIPKGIQHNDFIGEYIPPVNQWGLCYITSPLLPRRGFGLYRILSAFDATVVTIDCWSEDLTRDPIHVNVTLEEGDTWDSGVDQEDSNSTISSFHYCKMCANKPILVSQFSVGAFSDLSTKGNPSMVVLPPTDSYSNVITVSPANDNWNIYTDYVALVIPHADYRPDMIQVGTSPLSDLALKTMAIPPESPEFQVVRFEVSDAFRSITIRHNNPMARMGGIVYGVAKFTAYGHTGSFSKQQDIIVATEGGHIIPNNGYTAVQHPTTLTCYADLNVYDPGTISWLSPSGETVAADGDFVYQEKMAREALLHIQTNESEFEGYYFCQAKLKGIVKQLRIGVFVTPPAPSEVSSLSATAINSTAILLSWTPPILPHETDIVSYTVVSHDNSTMTYKNVDIPGNITEYVKGGLLPDTAYTVGVYATSMTGAGPASLTPPVITHRSSQEIQRCPQLKLSSAELNMEFSSHSRYIPVVLGTSVRVKCECEQSVSTSTPIWYFSTNQVQRNQSLTFHQIVQSRQATVVIEEFSLEHAGVYACRDFNVMSDFFLLPVDSDTGTELPFILSPPTSYRLELGTSVSLNCAVRGEGLMGVHWETKSGVKYPTTVPGKPLVLEHVGEEAQDEYRCVVHSASGDAIGSIYAKVAVYGTPTLLTNGNSKIVVNEGESLTLKCLVSVEARAVHSPKLVWFQNEDEILQDEQHALQHNQVRRTQNLDEDDDKLIHEFKLTLKNLTRNDLGIYECRLFHRIGISHRHAAFNVSVQYKPQNLQLSHSGSVAISRFSRSKLSLRCSVFGNPVPSMLWVRNGDVVARKTTENLRWVIDPSLPESNGRYTCIAGNTLGVAEKTFYVEIKDVDIYFRNASYSNNSYVTTGSSSRVNITCTLEGIDSREAKVAWYYPNGLVVGGAHGRGPYQTNTSSVEEKKVESVLTWQRSVLFEGSFNGEGFYRCHVTTNYGQEESVYLGIFAKIPVPGPPQGVTVQRVEPYSLKVTWTNPISFPSPLISQYTIRHYKTDREQYDPVQMVTMGTDSPLEYTFDSVELGADHTVGVAAVSEGGLGAMTVATPIKIPREALRGKKCESLRVQIHLPQGYQINAHRAEVPLNSGVAIFCSCFGADYLTITYPEWIFREETLPLSDTLRRGFFHLSRTRIAVLRITQFTLDDVGTYVCGDYHLRHTLTLVLKEAGDLREQPTGPFLLPRMVVALPGNPVQLMCDVEGASSGNFSWSTSSGLSVPPSQPRRLLYFGSFQRNNAGSYVCQLLGEFGIRTSRGVQIETYGPPTLVEGDEHTSLQFGEGKSIVLICKAKNHPLALDSVRFDWFKNNKKLVPDNRKIRIINSGENEKRIAYSTVQVSSAENSDEGIYRCLVRNRLGSTSRNMSVTVHPGPSNIVLTPPGPVRAVSDESFNVTCSASGDPLPKVQWRKNNNVVISQGFGAATFSVFRADKSDDAIYQCLAENKFGSLTKALRVQILDLCENRGLRCDDVCKEVYGVWQCVCRSGSVLVDRRTECKNCGRVPFRQPLEKFDKTTVPGIEEIPNLIFRLNYYTHPWTVALCDTTTNKIFCGGTLINNEWVLTLGSCVCSRSDYRGISAVFIDPFTSALISRGVIGATSNCRSYPVLASQALQIACHPSHGGSVQNDSVALVRIRTVNVPSVCLPSQEEINTPAIQAVTAQFFPNLVGGLVRHSTVNYRTSSSECSKGLSTSSNIVCISSTRAPCDRVGGTAIVSTARYGFSVVTALFNGHSSECRRHVLYEKHISVYPYVEWIRNTTNLYTYNI